jgi:plasmid stabilization system protein ParE
MVRSKYRELRSGIRRTILRRFPYAVYFAVEENVVVILAVLHAHGTLRNGKLAEANPGMQRTGYAGR